MLLVFYFNINIKWTLKKKEKKEHWPSEGTLKSTIYFHTLVYSQTKMNSRHVPRRAPTACRTVNGSQQLKRLRAYTPSSQRKVKILFIILNELKNIKLCYAVDKLGKEKCFCDLHWSIKFRVVTLYYTLRTLSFLGDIASCFAIGRASDSVTCTAITASTHLSDNRNGSKIEDRWRIDEG